MTRRSHGAPRILGAEPEPPKPNEFRGVQPPARTVTEFCVEQLDSFFTISLGCRGKDMLTVAIPPILGEKLVTDLTRKINEYATEWDDGDEVEPIDAALTAPDAPPIFCDVTLSGFTQDFFILVLGYTDPHGAQPLGRFVFSPEIAAGLRNALESAVFAREQASGKEILRNVRDKVEEVMQ